MSKQIYIVDIKQIDDELDPVSPEPETQEPTLEADTEVSRPEAEQEHVIQSEGASVGPSALLPEEQGSTLEADTEVSRSKAERVHVIQSEGTSTEQSASVQEAEAEAARLAAEAEAARLAAEAEAARLAEAEAARLAAKTARLAAETARAAAVTKIGARARGRGVRKEASEAEQEAQAAATTIEAAARGRGVRKKADEVKAERLAAAKEEFTNSHPEKKWDDFMKGKNVWNLEGLKKGTIESEAPELTLPFKKWAVKVKWNDGTESELRNIENLRHVAPSVVPDTNEARIAKEEEEKKAKNLKVSLNEEQDEDAKNFQKIEQDLQLHIIMVHRLNTNLRKAEESKQTDSMAYFQAGIRDAETIIHEMYRPLAVIFKRMTDRYNKEGYSSLLNKDTYQKIKQLNDALPRSQVAQAAQSGGGKHKKSIRKHKKSIRKPKRSRKSIRKPRKSIRKPRKANRKRVNTLRKRRR